MRPQRLLIARSVTAAVAGGVLAAALACPAQAAAGRSATPARLAAASRTAPARGPAGVQAAGADLVNAATGRRLWSRALNTERPIASITKVMTALVVLRAGHLNRKIRISQAVVTYVQEHDGSSADLVAGDVLTARQLLEGMLLPSGCDAAFALAGAYGPGWRAFVRKMNATARALGLRGTHFANFDGLPWPTEYTTYSTPRDLIILGRAAMRLPTFRDIVAQRTYYLPADAAAPRLLLAEHEPAARLVRRRRRHQDRVYARGRPQPAVRGGAARPHADRRRPGQLRHRLHGQLHGRQAAAELGLCRAQGMISTVCDSV